MCAGCEVFSASKVRRAKETLVSHSSVALSCSQFCLRTNIDSDTLLCSALLWGQLWSSCCVRVWPGLLWITEDLLQPLLLDCIENSWNFKMFLHLDSYTQTHAHTDQRKRKEEKALNRQEGILGWAHWPGIREVPVISLCLLFHSEATVMCCMCEFHKHSYVMAHEAVMWR